MNVPLPLLRRMHIACRMLMFMSFLVVTSLMAHAAQSTPNMITFENQSGRNAVVRVIGPTHAVAKMQRDETRIVRVAAGEYYILVRYGDSEKEYTYTKSAPFSVTQSEGKVSIITFTLHRRSGGTFNSQPVSGQEFETGLSTQSTASSP